MSTMTVESVFDEILATEESPFMAYAEVAEHYAYNLPENAVEFPSIDHMVRAVNESGSHYFDKDAIRFFRGRTHGPLYAGRFWVESRQYEDRYGDRDPREYQVAWVSRYNDSLSIEKLGRFDTLDKARRRAQHMATAATNES